MKPLSLLKTTTSPIVCLLALAGCSSAPVQTDERAAPSPADPASSAAPTESAAQAAEMRAALSTITSRLDSIETRMGSLNDKVAGTQNAVDMLMANRKALATPVQAHPSQGAGKEPRIEAAEDDPEAGFIADAAIQEYRKGAILLEARKYPEAVLAFTSFVERYPDHPLAGSAQYGIGKAYFLQKEHKLALRELERVLTSYDRSPHVSDTLRVLSETEEALNMPEQAARHRQLLTSLFPQSPAASEMLAARGGPAAPAAQAPAAQPNTESGLPTAPIAPSSTPEAE